MSLEQSQINLRYWLLNTDSLFDQTNIIKDILLAGKLIPYFLPKIVLSCLQSSEIKKPKHGGLSVPDKKNQAQSLQGDPTELK